MVWMVLNQIYHTIYPNVDTTSAYKKPVESLLRDWKFYDWSKVAKNARSSTTHPAELFRQHVERFTPEVAKLPKLVYAESMPKGLAQASAHASAGYTAPHADVPKQVTVQSSPNNWKEDKKKDDKKKDDKKKDGKKKEDKNKKKPDIVTAKKLTNSLRLQPKTNSLTQEPIPIDEQLEPWVVLTTENSDLLETIDAQTKEIARLNKELNDLKHAKAAAEVPESEKTAPRPTKLRPADKFEPGSINFYRD
ncbi:hypothetical protein OQA88_12986 [Cercophora sp. LCS_1]